MEIVDRKPRKAAGNTMTETEEERLFSAVIAGKDITEIIHTDRGDFTVKYMTFSDLIEVGNIIARRNGGLPANAFSEETERIIEMTAFLDTAIVDYPEWFKRAKEKNPYFSFADIPDDDFIADLYNRGRSFRGGTLAKIRRKGKREDSGTPSEKPVEASMGGGVFEGFSSERGV